MPVVEDPWQPRWDGRLNTRALRRTVSGVDDLLFLDDRAVQIGSIMAIQTRMIFDEDFWEMAHSAEMRRGAVPACT